MKKFYELTADERIALLRERGLTEADAELLRRSIACYQPEDGAPEPIENFVGFMSVPLGVVPRIVVNGKPYMVPIAIEERTLIAGVAAAAKLAEPEGGFEITDSSVHWQGGEVVLEGVDPNRARLHDISADAIESHAHREGWPFIRRGFRLIKLDTHFCDPDGKKAESGRWFVLRFRMTCGEAMGARIVTETAELLSRYLEKMTGGKKLHGIVTNSECTRYMASARWRIDELGADVAERIISANAYAAADRTRAATQMKGAMNAVDGVLVATGNDWRAAEAANHRWLDDAESRARVLRYWREEQVLHGAALFSIACGTVGSATDTPMARLNRRILGVENVLELGSVAAACGLAANFSALRTLVTTGICAPFDRMKPRRRS